LDCDACGRRHRRHVGGKSRQQVRVSRIVTVLFASVGMFLATQVQHLGNIVEIGQKAIQTFTGPLLGLFLLGMFTQRTSGTS
jgi:Na+(H+)/acetate symporter ActP